MLSIVIPSYNGEGRLPALLSALMPQLDEGDEVIVVDDASTDRTVEIASGFGVRVHTLNPNKGVGHARNAGAKLAKNSFLVYFDDDVVPIEGYLKIVRETFADPDVICFQGPHHLDPAGDEAGLWGRVEAAIWHYQNTQTMVRDGRCLTLYTGAFCIKRDFLLDLGGFDESFGSAGGEEFELAMRMIERIDIKFVPQLQSHHRFKRLWHRLRVLRLRARHYPGLTKTNSLLPRSLLIPEILRQLAVIGSIGFVVVGIVFPPIIPLAFGCGVLFLCLEALLMYHLMKWRLWHLVVPAAVFRFLTYSVIALGISEGLLQNVLKRQTAPR